MSFDAMRWAMVQQGQEPGIGSSAKLVLLILADHVGDDGRAWPSMARLASLGCMSERTARDAVRALEASGLIRSEARTGSATVYRLQMDTPAISAAPAKSAAPANSADHPGEICPPPRQDLPPTPAKSAPEPIREPIKEAKEGEGSPQAASPPSAPRASRLPDDWAPSEADVAYARSLGLDPVRVAQRFGSHWWNKSGAAGRKVRWWQVWQEWCRTDAERQGAGGARASPAAARRPAANGAVEWLLREQERAAYPPSDRPCQGVLIDA